MLYCFPVIDMKQRNNQPIEACRFLACVMVLTLAFIGLFENWFMPTRHDAPLHFSIDDTIKLFVDLTDNQDTYSSIFDNETLRVFKDLHERYGARFTFYCYYQQGDFNLSMVPDRFRSDFVANSDWLRFGYHVMDPGTDLADISAKDITREYQITVAELNRITGSVATVLRLSSFHGNREAVQALSEHGVSALLTADDDRQSYYLDADHSRYIADHDIYIDDVMTFISTDLRLDRLQGFEVLLNLLWVAFDDRQNGIMVVFTHEWLLDQAIYSKIEMLCRFAMKYHYYFVTDF